MTRALSLSSIAPTSAAAGGTIVLNGSNLTGATAIVFAGGGVNTVTSSFSVNAAGTQITGVVVPSGAETGILTVITPNGTATRTFTVTTPATPAQPAWQTLTGATTSLNSNSISVTTPDASGNVYVSGGFYGQLTLGSFVLTGATNRPLPFIAKWNPATNTYLWAQALSAYNASVAAVAVSGSSVYLAGSYFDLATFGNTTLSTPGGRDVFVAKLTDAGTSASFDWAVGGGGPGFDFISALAVQGTSLYVAGSFGESNPRGRTYNATFGSYTLASAGLSDAFVAKLTDAGNTASYTWAVRAGGNDSEGISSLAVNGTNLYVGGTFYSNDAAFGTTTLRNPLTYGQIFSDAFVAKLTDAGGTASFVWAQQIGGISTDGLSALVAQGPNIYVAGTYVNSANFGTLSVGSATAYGGDNAFVAKLLDGGMASSFVWVQPISTASNGSINAPALAVSGRNLYVAGSAYTGARFGNATLRTVGNTLDCYLAKIVDSGSTSNFAWVQQGGGSTNYDQALTLALSDSRVLLGGYLQYGADFGQLNVNNVSSPNTYSFLASLTDVTLLAAQVPTGAPRAALALYPNPAHATATVQLPPAATATTSVLTLSDALGRLHRTQTVAVPAAGRLLDLDLTGLAPGMYVVRLVGAGTARTQRLVVE
ncbi:hypothetical protein GCM10028822_39720 [Hymenobacter terrigena]